MRQTFKKSVIAAAITATLLSGCGTVQTQVRDLESSVTRNIAAEQAKAAQPLPVVTTTPGAWLMGQSVQVLLTPSPILTRVITYAPTQRVTLSDVAAWISNTTGLVVDTAEVQQTANTSQMAGQGVGTPGVPGAFGVRPLPPLPPGMAMGMAAGLPAGAQGLPPSTQPMSISYEGSLSGLLDVVANKSGVWWKFSDGRLIFYRTETKTFYLPAISRKSAGGSSITTITGTGSAGTTASGGATSTSDYMVDVWGDLEKTARTVGGGAQVVANASLGSLTVTGTPTQVRDVEEWAKNLSDNLSQQVSITVNIYSVNVTHEDNYNWSPSVVFKSLSAGVTLAGPQVPAVLSGLTPLNIAATVLQTATGNAANYSGSQLAVQALSTLGQVTETMRQTVVTLNGQPAPMQVANQQSYLASTTPGAATTIGAAPVPPTLTPGQITTGFTGMFLPRIVNGKILMTMHMVSSTLKNMGSAGSGGSFIQTPNVDTSTFPQSVSLTPGDSLLLTGLQLDNGSSNHSGVGSPSNYALGGGADNSTGKKLIAIVITAKVL
jgi:type IVB pilus formation R64 PilN family outer membrane protein